MLSNLDRFPGSSLWSRKGLATDIWSSLAATLIVQVTGARNLSVLRTTQSGYPNFPPLSSKAGLLIGIIPETLRSALWLSEKLARVNRHHVSAEDAGS